MADFTVRQKYPAAGVEGPVSMRLDHPNWGDVRRTVFAKGVIIDFQEVSDDPMKVQPLVKVRIGEEESDFIPIFFHPKPLYWDDSEHEATDFNEGGKYFEKAWMSFRCDDEVIVLTKFEGDPPQRVPKYVMGFADGCPRIGEDIFQIDFDKYEFPSSGASCQNLTTDNYKLQCSKHIRYTEETGPDGLDLSLFSNFELISRQEEEASFEALPLAYRTYRYPWQFYLDYPPIWQARFGPYPGSGIGAWVDRHWDGSKWVCDQARHEEYRNCHGVYIRLHEFSFIVGPFLYLLCVLSTRSYEIAQWAGNWDGCGYVDHIVGGDTIYWKDDITYQDEDNWVINNSYPDVFVNLSMRMKAGLYSKELLESIKASSPISAIDAYVTYMQSYANDWTSQYDGMITQEVWGYSGPGNIPYSACMDPDTFDILTRPHTKEELIEASMWPE